MPLSGGYYYPQLHVAATKPHKTVVGGFQRQNQGANLKTEMSGTVETPVNVFYYVAPSSGSIVGLSARELAGTAVAGQPVTFSASINGVAQSGPTLTLAAGAASGSAEFNQNVYRFHPGDRLGIYVATITGYTTTTNDYHAWLAIEM
jgi:hypothetical protein